jgi:hypothetical protein
MMISRAILRVALFAAGAFSAACSGGGSSHGTGPADAGDAGDDGGSGPAALTALTVSSGILRPDFDPSVSDYDVTSLNSLHPISVTATTTTPGAKLTIHGTAAKSGVASSFTLMPKEDFTVVVSATGLPSGTYTVHYVPSDFPTYTVMSEAGAGTEDVLLDPDGEYIAIVDRAGNPLYYRTFLPQDVENFQQTQVPDGGTFYSVNVGVTNPSGWTLGVDHVMDDQFNDVADYQLLAHAQHGVLQAEGHDFLLLGDQHYVAMAYVQRTLDLSSINPAWGTMAQVMSCVMQEVDQGSVLMEWDSANVPSLYTDSIFASMIGPSMLTDYLHLNSITIDPSDGNFIVSFRYTNSVVKINRQTAAIMWTMGGTEDQYGLTPEQVFASQHHVEMQADGTLTMFDDGNGNYQSRALSFVLDQVNHKVTSFNVLYTRPMADPPSGYMGSVVPLSGGRLFIGWGGWFTTQIAADATEVLDGGAVWSLQFSQGGVFSYRALPIVSP